MSVLNICGYARVVRGYMSSFHTNVLGVVEAFSGYLDLLIIHWISFRGVFAEIHIEPQRFKINFVGRCSYCISVENSCLKLLKPILYPVLIMFKILTINAFSKFFLEWIIFLKVNLIISIRKTKQETFQNIFPWLQDKRYCEMFYNKNHTSSLFYFSIPY